MRIRALCCAVLEPSVTTVRRIYFDPSDGPDDDLAQFAGIGFQSIPPDGFDIPKSSVFSVQLGSPLVDLDIHLDGNRRIRVSVLRR